MKRKLLTTGAGGDGREVFRFHAATLEAAKLRAVNGMCAFADALREAMR